MYGIENIDNVWMRYAMMLADCANLLGEVSVGAVLIYDGSVVGYGWNASIARHDPTAHAEILALRMGGSILHNYRLLGTTLYVTLEPCIMCIGAMLHARIYRLVYGATNKKKIGKTIFVKSVLGYLMQHHHMLLTTGVLQYECSVQLSSFFLKKRKHFCNKKFI